MSLAALMIAATRPTPAPVYNAALVVKRSTRAHGHTRTRARTQAHARKQTYRGYPTGPTRVSRFHASLCMGRQQQQRVSRQLSSHNDGGRLPCCGLRQGEIVQWSRLFAGQAGWLLCERCGECYGSLSKHRPRRRRVPQQAAAVRWCAPCPLTQRCAMSMRAILRC